MMKSALLRMGIASTLAFGFAGTATATASATHPKGLHLNPETVTAAQLKALGLPARPTDPRRYPRWAFLISQARTEATGPLRVRSAHPVPFVASPHATSPNWSGYYNHVRSYNMGANWNVPYTSSASTSKWSSVWVGLGGVSGAGSSDPLIQAGTDQDVSGGAAHYGFWWEIYSTVSNQEYYVPISVAPGQNVEVDISVSGRTANFFMENVSTHVYKDYNVTLSSKLSGCTCNSVDYIVEDQGPNPYSNRNLANFHYVVYKGAYDYNSANTFQHMNSTPKSSYSMVDASGTVAQPGAVNSAGTGFTLYRTATP